MALDFHIAADLEEASMQERPRYSMDLQTHASLVRAIQAGGSPPILVRLRDFFGDAVIAGQDLVQAETELARLRDTVAPNDLAMAALRELEQVTREAIEAEMSVLAVCD